MILGLSGFARSGKDTFCDLAIKYYSKKNRHCKRFAFADELKKDMDDFLIEKFKISSFSEDPNEKKIIRPLLVSYGNAKREVSNGMYWIDSIRDEADLISKNGGVAIVTDVRFENELNWINSNKGSSIHITREGNQAANQEEEDNDPIVKLKSKYNFYWENFKDVSMEEAEKNVFGLLPFLEENVNE